MSIEMIMFCIVSPVVLFAFAIFGFYQRKWLDERFDWDDSHLFSKSSEDKVEEDQTKGKKE
jgi:phosphate/sulfate permease